MFIHKFWLALLFVHR